MQLLHKYLIKKSRLYSAWHNMSISGIVHDVIFVLVAGFMSFNLIGSFMADAAIMSTPTSVVQKPQNTKKDSVTITTELLRSTKKYNDTPEAQQHNELRNVIASAVERKSIMLEAAKNNPKAFLLAAIPSDTKKGMPAEVAALIESEKDIEGKYSMLYVDQTENKGYLVHQLKDKVSGKTYALHFAQGEPSIRTGSTVRAKGVGIDNELVLAGLGSQSITTTSAPQALTSTVSTGDQRTLVMLVTFSNAPTNPWTPQDVSTLMFAPTGSINAFFKETSYNQISFSGDVTNWITIPYANTGCNSNYGVWASAADSAATAMGYNLANYSKKLYMLAGTADCGWIGLSYVGATPGQSWVTTNRQSVIAHELGHAVGMMHASSYACGSSAIDVASNCTHTEYGDPFDVLGPAPYFHFSGAHKAGINWLPSSNITTVSSGVGQYTITPQEFSTSSKQVIKVYRPDTGGYYYIEYRAPYGYDASLPAAALSGVGIRYYPGGVVTTELLDTTPGDGTFSNSYLSDGASFYDKINNITITQLSHDSSGATVSVNYGAAICNKTIPTVSVSPLSQTGSSGKTLTYTVSVANKDSSGCGPTQFNIAGANLPAGFITSSGALSLNPGSSGSQTIGVTSSSGTLDGNYVITFQATDSADTTHAGQNQATYISVTDNSAPNVTILSPANGAKIGNTTNISVAATDNIGVSRIDILIDSNKVISTNSSKYTYKWNSRKTSSGTHTITAIAYDAAGNSSKASISVTK